MPDVYIQDKTFDKTDFTQEVLAKGEYEKCIFQSCNFSENNLSQFRFTDCEFVGCNLSLAKVTKTSWRDVKFKQCKMLGLRFDTSNEFSLSFSFDQCTLNHSSFYKTKIKKTVLKNSQLHEVDFSETDLSGAVFDTCDLMRATFDGTILEKADFRMAFNYSIDPEKNRMKKARFALSGISGLLDKYELEIEG
jgi:fluoroquinolone resistance protein